MVPLKVYLASSISQSYEIDYTAHIAEVLQEMGFEVYAAALNTSINDKSKDPTPLDIYEGDVEQLLNSDILLVNLTGSQQDGTISEVGFVAGINEVLSGFTPDFPDMLTKKIIGYTTNKRLQHPQHHLGIPSAHANHLVLGMIEKWGHFLGNEDSMLDYMDYVSSDYLDGGFNNE